MKEQDHGTLGLCPATTETGAIVSIAVNPTHPLLQLKRALPWEALCEVMTRPWRRAGKNTGGGPGLPWDVAWYVPLVLLDKLVSYSFMFFVRKVSRRSV